VTARTKILLFGAGGHARVVLDVVERQGRHEVALVLDDRIEAGRDFCGVPVSGGRERLSDLGRLGIRHAIVGIGANADRAELAGLLAAAGATFVVAIDPGAHIGRDVTVGQGTVVMPGAVVNAGTTIGEHVIVNTSASVDHDCTVDSLVHVAPGVHAAGGCRFGEASHIGIGATIIEGIRIGKRAVIGAGAVVVDDVPDDTTVIGVPARPVRRHVP
jgi:UDP-N-acetylbacillosamine N-acetyltransferase